MARKRLDSEARRTQIVKVAIECIAKEGVHEATFSKIAKAAKVQQSLLNYYFPSSEALLIECVHAVLDSLKAHMIAAIEREMSQPEQALISYMLSPVDWIEDNPELQPTWIYFYHLAALNPRFRQLNNEIRRTGRERIAFLVFRILEARKITLKDPWTADGLAWALQSMTTGFVAMTATEDADYPKLKSMMKASVDTFLASDDVFGPAPRGKKR